MEIKIVAENSFAATFGRLKVAKVDFKERVTVKIKKQKIVVQIARCETTSIELAGCSSGQ